MNTQQDKRHHLNSPSGLLVASPYAGKTPYGQSVVLLVRQDQRGAAGILVDRAFRDSVVSVSQRRQQSDLPPGEKVEQQAQLTMLNWTNEKLLAELQSGIWLTTPAIQADLAREDLWVDLVRQIGRSVLQDSLGIEQFPAEPSLN